MTTYTVRIFRIETTGLGTAKERTEYLHAVKASITLDIPPPQMGMPVQLLPLGKEGTPPAIVGRADGPWQYLPSGNYSTKLFDLHEPNDRAFNRLIQRFTDANWTVEPTGLYG